ncbi:lipopolysaccharide assembly LapA domain-containing protein [Pseudogracilibacillus auburnensis]|uniref:Putative integral membrane protein n=1 Tax=Pseudogracilibacillus auburnensis TaxID=1494959 RepID=A0A2V3W2W0_9BACI|nr:LapA family protein [Pseudogracilibacillus auburnensis]MBO1003418.1 LapA family protein [Pseudogracilibacillus auburnensis]PXW86595.1 putative integral membrane protein [Pseudogracilibacillus auburnensis]
MKGQTYVILTIIFIIVISVFAVLNVGAVEVNYVFWRGSSPLIFVILFSVLLGGILTTVVGSKKYFRLKRENKQLREQVNHKELDELNGLNKDEDESNK